MKRKEIINILKTIGFIEETPEEYFQGNLINLNPYYFIFQKRNDRCFHIDGYSIEVDVFFKENKDAGKK